MKRKIESMSHGPYAISKEEDGKVVFIENACPDDFLELTIFDDRKDFAFGSIKNIIKESPKRNNNPKCKLHKICGGCQWQHIDYKFQLLYKRNNLIDLLIKAKVDTLENSDPDKDYFEKFIGPCIGMEDPWFYRNKIIYPVETIKSSGRLMAGYYKRKSHDLINIKFCPIQHKVFDSIIERLKELCSVLKIQSPFLRHILLRSNINEDEILLSLIIRKKLLSEDLKSKLKELFLNLNTEFPSIKSFSLNYNDASTNVIMGREEELILGKDHIVDTLGSMKFKISAQSFFQINNSQFLKILDLIKKSISENINSGDKLLDAYSGIGTISLSLSKAFPDLDITGIEEVPSAVKNAQENINLNFDENKSSKPKLKYINSKMEDKVESLKKENFKFIIINPPRAGCSNKVLEMISEIEPEFLIYVSCNPSTFSRDLAYLKNKNYGLSSLTAVDLFPHSFHVESLGILKRRSGENLKTIIV